MIDYIEQTSAKKIPVLLGENIRLVPFFDVLDMDKFIELHRKDRRGYMCRFCLKNFDEEGAEEYIRTLIDGGDLFIWNVEAVNYDNTRVGFIYLTSVNEGHSVSINGIMDKKIVKEILLKGRREGLTYADEASKLLIETCFKAGFERVEGDCIEDDREALALHKRIGMKQEGILRKAAKIGDELKNVIIASIIREDFYGKE